jgi:hypothetical protein
VLAIVLVLLAGLLAGAVADLVSTTSRFSQNMDADRQTTYAADGAVTWAINATAQTIQPGGVTCRGGPAPLNPMPGLTSAPPGLAVVAKSVSPMECTYMVSAGDTIYVTADVQFFPPPTTPTAVVVTWVNRPPPSPSD